MEGYLFLCYNIKVVGPPFFLFLGGRKKMNEIDIIIDKLTDCLEDNDGKSYDTEFRFKEKEIKPNDYKGWKFDWSKTQKQGNSVYELFLKGEDVVQGRISFILEGGAALVDIVESAPWNIGQEGKYHGVGPHLFAIACKYSYEAGYDGCVAFTAKDDLIQHYQDSLHAVLLGGRRMGIFEDAAKILLDKYIF